MFFAISYVAVLALGFGFGRVHHPANLKLAAIKAEIMKIESDGVISVSNLFIRLKSLL
jgi:hypothetical protein